MDKLKNLDSRIRAIARRYSSDFHEREDLEQAARLGVWKKLEENPEAEIPLLHVVAERRMIDLKQKDFAKKRGGWKKTS